MRRSVLSSVLQVWLLTALAAAVFVGYVLYVNAALVTIDSSLDITTTQHLGSSPTIVSISTTTAYAFYVDVTNQCVYAKSTDGGASWGGAVVVDAQADCIRMAVWYDRWTPGDDTGNIIHVATIDIGDDDIFYTRVDTSNDSVSTTINITSGSTYAGILLETANGVSITKATDGDLFASTLDTSDSIVVTCATTCTTALNWSETSPTFALGDDYPILVPLASGSVMLIQWDTSADDLQSKVFNGTTWDAAWTTFEANAADNTTYDAAFGASINRASNTVYLVAVDDASTLGTDDDVKTWRYNGTWAATGNAVTNSSCAGVANCGLTDAKVAVDQYSGDVYVLYTARSTPGTATTANVRWKRSTDQMASWGSEQGPLDTTNDDMYGARISLMGPRLYATWYGANLDDLFGETVMVPTLTVGTTSAQSASLAIGTTSAHIGGTFTFIHNTSTTTLSSITLTETGSVDAQNDLDNIRLVYDRDTTAPYDCASESYSGSETQFGATDTDGFSAANGTATFTSGISTATSSVICMYVVLDVTTGASDGETLDIEITTPNQDVLVTQGIVSPAQTRSLSGVTTLQRDNLTQVHYHWRNDGGSESTATSSTGGVEDTPLLAFSALGNKRLRLEVSNEGTLVSAATQYRLEYGTTTSSCGAITTWVDVGQGGGAWDMFNSPHLTDGSDTTNIALGIGGVTDENTTFETPNAAVKETSSQTGNITLSSTEFVELEYSIQALSGATPGTSYCFRASAAGSALPTYSVYAEATIAADVTVSVTGTQTADLGIPSTNQYVGGAFTFFDNVGSRNVTNVTITETGTVNGATGLDNIRLYYDLDTSAPYDCASESYAGSEPQFGLTDTDGFSSANGSSTFSGVAAISTTATMCAYVVLDVLSAAVSGQTLDVEIANATVDVTVSSGTTAPTSPQEISGSTILQSPLLVQEHYHFRNDNGSESGATSATAGVQDTALTGVRKNDTIRMRIAVSNEGLASSVGATYRLEYGERSTTCAAIGSWADVGLVGGAFDMSDSLNLTESADTTNIGTSIGGVTDENTTFKTPNSGVKDTSSQTAAITLATTEFVELEFAVEATDAASYSTTYCFRLTNAGTILDTYDVYPTLTTEAQRDFFVQRGVTTLTNGNLTASITAGVDYTAPKATTSAFIRITNTGFTGAGHNVGGGTQNATNVTTFIQDPRTLDTAIVFERFGGTNSTRIAWEIVEYVGPAGGDNEFVVRAATSTQFAAASFTATTTTSGVVDDTDVAVFVTSSASPDVGTNYEPTLVTSEWFSATDQAVLTRGTTGSDAIRASMAVIEFTGPNWRIQRDTHVYAAAGVAETSSITAVNDLSRAFIHAQKRVHAALPGMDEYGQEVRLSATNQLEFTLQAGAGTPSAHRAVVWVIENTQTNGTPMLVTRSNYTQSGGAEPNTTNFNINATIANLNTASIFTYTRTSGTGTQFPRPLMAVRLVSTTQYEVWLSDTGSTNTFRTEVVEWPTAVRTMTQNYYRFYVDNDALDPSDPWPLGVTNLGENTALTSSDSPIAIGERIRIRMSVTVRGANLTASTTAFKLQQGLRSTTCGAITTWLDVGGVGSTTAAWRGYDATPGNGTALSGNPPTLGDLNLSVSDRAGSYVEGVLGPGNPHKVFIGEDVEYDWILENNAAVEQGTYCFRLVEYTNTPLTTYSFYPTLTTAGFEVESSQWRWYDDETSLTPSTALASENVAPTNIAFDNLIKLRVTAAEIGNGEEEQVKFRLQFSELSDFSDGGTFVEETGSCTPLSYWCYANGAGDDNGTTTSAVLSDADACVGAVGAGCGTHNESGISVAAFRHAPLATAEYEFTVRNAGARVNTTYFFRLYDATNAVAVVASSTYPSLVTEGAALTFTLSGVSSGTATEGVTTDVTTTASSVPFGALPSGAEVEAAQRISVTTNATGGYRLYTFARQGLLSGGNTIAPVSGTNASPNAWGTGCSGTGCFGYHAGDDVLSGSSARFAPNDTYAQFTSSLAEIAYSSIP
ncbi:MAG: hypothetical protein NBV63_01305, partial [Candidatus Pacebacteria bacterium]|nr:hypothetical protein [Candidatus Paceibacterota bacterium]